LLLAAPGFIDWTEYRAAFAERLSATTGRPVSIDGNVDFVLLPRPAFNAEAVRIGGELAEDFVAIERLSARLAFLPLLRGDLAFRELVLRRPEARITRSQTGGMDFLNFAPPAPDNQSPAAAPQATQLNLDVDRLTILEGVLTWQDSANGTSISLHDMDLRIVAPPMSGVSIAGEATAGEVPFKIDGTLSRATNSGARTITLATTLSRADAGAKFSGTYNGASGEVRGDVSLTSDNAAAMLTALGAVDANAALPQALRKPLSLASKIRATSRAVTLDPLTVDIGGTPVTGTVAWQADVDVPPNLDVKLQIGATDIEAWRFAAAVPVERTTGFTMSAFAQAPPAPPSGALFAPFKNLNAKFDLRAPLIAYRGQTLRDAAVMASVSNGELTVSDASVALPAATRLRAVGLQRLEAQSPFEGIVEMTTADLRGLIAWLGVETDAGKLSPGRLSNASFKATMQATSSQIALNDVVAAIDTSNIVGRVSWLDAPLAAWNIDLTINTLNADAYLPLFSSTPAVVNAVPAAPAVKPDTYGVTSALPSFPALANVNADVQLRIDALTYGGVANGKAGIDVALNNGTLTVRSASFENVGGATAWFSGAVAGFGQALRMDDMQFDLSADDMARVSRAFGFELPEQIKAIKPLSLTGIVKGTLVEADVSAKLRAANLNVQAEGKILNAAGDAHVTLDIDATDASFSALVKAAGVVWPLTMADPGATKFTARIVHDQAVTDIQSFALTIGKNAAAGALRFGRNEVTGTLTGLNFDVDKVWPRAEPAVSTAPAPARSARPAVVAKPPPWSDELFDWSMLDRGRADVRLSGPSLTVRGMQAQDFSVHVLAGGGTFEINEWAGKIFGAPGQIYLRAASTPTPSVQGEIAFLGGDLGAISGAVNGNTTTLKSIGKADFAASFRAEGLSLATMMQSLSGSGNIKITAADAGGGAISGLLGAITAARQLEGGGKTGNVTLESRFSAAQGAIKVEDATVASKSYGGAFTGVIDLGRWQVDLSGRLRLEASGAANTGKPASVPIAIKGALDLPNVALLPSR